MLNTAFNKTNPISSRRHPAMLAEGQSGVYPDPPGIHRETQFHKANCQHPKNAKRTQLPPISDFRFRISPHPPPIMRNKPNIPPRPPNLRTTNHQLRTISAKQTQFPYGHGMPCPHCPKRTQFPARRTKYGTSAHGGLRTKC